MMRAGHLVVYLVLAVLTIMEAHYTCQDCGTKFTTQYLLTWHKEQSASCRAVRAMKAAEELAKAGKSDPSVDLEDDHDFDAPEGPFYDESEAIEISEDEDALNSDEDDGDEENEGVQVVESLVGTKRKFNSELETLLWMNAAGIGGSSLPDRS